MGHPPLILASGSPRRRGLLASLGWPFTVQVSDVDERRLDGEAAEAYSSRLAAAKAEAAARTVGEGLVIGADTIVVLDGEILGKPADPDQARRYLSRLRGRRHLVATAVAVVDAAVAVVDAASPGKVMTKGHRASGITWTGVWLRDFGDEERDAYIATGDPLDKAGAYAIQHGAFKPVARIEGSETNVIGLPLGLLQTLLGRFVN